MYQLSIDWGKIGGNWWILPLAYVPIGLYNGRVVNMFGERLQELRQGLGISRDELAVLSGLTASYIYRIEAGRHPRPSQNTVEKLAKGLGVSPAELVGTEQFGPGRVETEPELPADVGEIEAHALAIHGLNPEAVRYLARLAKAIHEEEEHKYQEAKRAKRGKPKSIETPGQADKKI